MVSLSSDYHIPTIWARLVAEVEQGRRVFFALVVESTHGSPGTPSSAMLITQDGEQTGTIGGGCMEQNLILFAQQALLKNKFKTCLSKLQHRNTAQHDASGLICGGSQTNLLTVFDASHLLMLETVGEFFNNDRAGVLSISAESWHFEADQSASRSIWLEQAQNWQVCVSTQNRKRVAIFGGGHCGSALARQMLRLGFSVCIIETRAGLYTAPANERITLFNTQTFAAGAALVYYPEMTFAVVLTTSAQQDVDALSGILNYPFVFIGVMGSSEKVNMICNAVKDRGFDDACWQRVTAPVGLCIASDTPEEIAVSISAQILNISRQLGLR